MDRNHAGRITRAELIKTVRSDAGVRAVLGLPQHIGEAQRSELEAVFQGMDVDDSRGVDFNEFAGFMRRKFAATPAATPAAGSAIGAGVGEIAPPREPEPFRCLRPAVCPPKR